MKDPRLLVDTIRSAKEIAIACHINPDGDSIGSVLSLGLGLERIGKRVVLISQDGIPKRYKELPAADRIVNVSNAEPDLAISVDCSSIDMLGSAAAVFERSKHILEIDHHEYRKSFGEMGYIDKKASSVGEMIYLLLHHMKIKITNEIAQNILTSIIVETNSFRLPNIRPLTFRICYELLRHKVNFYKLVDMVFWSRTSEAALLLGLCLSRCEFMKNRQIAWSIVRADDFKRIGGSDEDVDPVADELRSIKEVKIALLFRERPNGMLRVSLRSKGKINVASLAERYSGGGHFDSAGCYIPNEPKALKEMLRLAEELL